MEKIDDVFERLRHKAMIAAGQGSQPRLLPDRHPTRDFFIADILDWALKDDRHSMEHPTFSLAKTPDHKIRRYEHNGIAVFANSYLLGCGSGAAKAYHLLIVAMTNSQRAALAKFVMRGKEHLVLIRSYRDVLMMHTMHWPRRLSRGKFPVALASGALAAPIVLPVE